MLISDVLRESAARLTAAGVEAAEFEARVLLEEALGTPAGRLFQQGERRVGPREAELLERALVQRGLGVPLQYVIGRWEFCGVQLALERGVLIPRPETEELVEAVLALVPLDAAGAALDLGTGSGAIAVALARARPTLRVEAWDVNPRAVRLARRNARLSGVGERLRVCEADLRTAPLADGSLALVVSNPPYIASDEIARLDASVRDFESHLALDGGADGLALIRAVLDRARTALEPGGLVALEIGHDQGPRARALAEERGFGAPEVRKDMAGKDRVLLARQRS